MAVKKEKPAAMSLVKAPFINSLQNVMDQGNLLVAALDAVIGHSSMNNKVEDLLKERLKAFREAMYGPEE